MRSQVHTSNHALAKVMDPHGETMEQHGGKKLQDPLRQSPGHSHLWSWIKLYSANEGPTCSFQIALPIKQKQHKKRKKRPWCKFQLEGYENKWDGVKIELGQRSESITRPTLWPFSWWGISIHVLGQAPSISTQAISFYYTGTDAYSVIHILLQDNLIHWHTLAPFKVEARYFIAEV